MRHQHGHLPPLRIGKRLYESPHGTARELTHLKRLFAVAIQSGKLLHKPYIPMLKESAPRAGFFEPHQFESVRAHLPAVYQGLVTFAYITGWRSSEIKEIQWSQVDFLGRTVRLDPGTTKNDEGRVFPFTLELERVLLAQWESTRILQRGSGVITPWVFHRADGSAIQSFRKAWHRACRQAGCPGRILHDFRRTAVRSLERAGVPRQVAMAMVGHKTEAIYRRYAIVSASDLTRAAQQLDHAAGIVSGIVLARTALARGSFDRFAEVNVARPAGLL